MATSRSLVIVESPAKAKTIEKYLGKGFDVRASVGHIMDLPKNDIGVELKNRTFEPELIVASTNESNKMQNHNHLLLLVRLENVRFFSSTPMSFLGRSMMCPTDARTSNPLPRYFSIVFALAGDSTITSDRLVAILNSVPSSLSLSLPGLSGPLIYPKCIRFRFAPVSPFQPGAAAFSSVVPGKIGPQVLHPTTEHRLISTRHGLFFPF